MLLPSIPTQEPEILFYRPIDEECVTLRVYGSSVAAGFPSPAADYIMEEIDLGKELIPKPLSTFVVRVTGIR